jgi:beta-glucosidase-like glycosyl hydrolase
MLPFQFCVEQGKVSGLMCSYNAVNGVPSCANHWLLTEVARDEWGFDGYVCWPLHHAGSVALLSSPPS